MTSTEGEFVQFAANMFLEGPVEVDFSVIYTCTIFVYIHKCMQAYVHTHVCT